MPAAGYDIGVAGSQAFSASTPQSSGGEVNFFFGNGDTALGGTGPNQTSTPTSTAVATTKSPGASNTIGTGESAGLAPVPGAGGGNYYQPQPPFSISGLTITPPMLLVLFGGLLLVLAIRR